MRNGRQIQELCEQLNDLRKVLIRLEGDDPDDKEEYRLYPAANMKTIESAEQRLGFRYPDSYRTFLQWHNGWLGFWPDWSLVGIPRKDNKEMYDDIKNTLNLLSTVADKETRAKLPEQEKVDSSVIMAANHPALGTDFNGSLLVFDCNRVGSDGEPEIAWVHYGMHVERRWTNFEALIKDAIQDTQEEIAELQEEES